jgi:gamma-glutamyl:cysteine ligase YbdK (ATP-grasp superfamily)
MGQEIETASFSDDDFAQFSNRLEQETAHLRSMFDAGVFADSHEIAGFELEAWLIDSDTRPAPVNKAFLERLNDPLVVHELSRFNIELNSTPRLLKGDALAQMSSELEARWRHCIDVATDMETRLAMTGILPVVKEQELTLQNMSAVKRYKALNEQILRLRRGSPLRLSIKGVEHLQTEHSDVMLESAATSFQVHMQVRPDQAARYYNAACIVSAPIVAIASNSPYLFGRNLWHETRIPLFEQSVNTTETGSLAMTGKRRVTFGHGYIDSSMMELFEENLALYPVLLPEVHQRDTEELYHLRLHNGTIWRWNRPLIGLDEHGYHLRIEHRVIPSGPTIADMMANAALFYGLVQALAHKAEAPERRLPFETARENFYRAARDGLSSPIEWPGRGAVQADDLLRSELIPLAGEGLASLGVDDADIRQMIRILDDRAASGQTGSAWQRAYCAQHRCSFRDMTEAYLRNQQSGRPVHSWTV